MLLLFFVGLVNAALLYPPNEQQLQFQDEGLFVDCVNQEKIKGENTSDNLDQIIESYFIQTPGMCSEEISLQTQLVYVFLRTNHNLTDDYKVEISNSRVLQQVIENQVNMIQIELLNLNSPIQIKITPLNDKINYVIDLKITDSTLPDGCLQAEGYYCSECDTDYFRYYGACFEPSQVDNITNIAYNGFNSNQSIQDGQLEVEFDMSPNMLGSIGRIYIQIVDNFQDFSNPYFIPNSQLTFTNHQLIKARIGIEDLQSSNCRQLYTSDSIFYQCYFNLLLTLQGQIQFQYLKLLTLQINRATRTQLTIGAQDIGQNQNEQQIDVLSDASIFQFFFDNQSYILLVNQTIIDPNYYGQSVKYIQSSLIINSIAIREDEYKFLNLSRINQSLILFSFQIPQSLVPNSTNITLNISITSQISEQTQRRRLLQRTRFNIEYFTKPKVDYSQNKKKLEEEIPTTSRQLNNQQIILIIVVSCLGLLCIFGATLWLLNQRKTSKTGNQATEVEINSCESQRQNEVVVISPKQTGNVQLNFTQLKKK